MFYFIKLYNMVKTTMDQSSIFEMNFLQKCISSLIDRLPSASGLLAMIEEIYCMRITLHKIEDR